MEGLWILLAFVAVLVVIIVPIVSLIKIFSVESRLEGIERKLKQLNVSGSKNPPAAAAAVEVAPAVKEEKIFEQPPIPEPAPAVVEAMPEVPVKELGLAYLYAAIEEKTDIPVYAMPAADSTNLTEEAPPAAPTKRKARKEAAPYHFENLLSKIGIVTLVLGIAFFVKYAIDKDWINEVGRVAIGVLTGGLLIGIAHKLRKKYELFSALMTGGGVSVLYITITLAFREYHLFSQPLAFGMLIAITLFSVILSLLYNRKELALFSLLGGYASPLLVSTGAGNYVVLFSFLFILNCGMLVISMRKKWGIIGIVSFVCTQLFYWIWLSGTFESQYAGALVFTILFFVQFYLLALFDHFLSNKKISPFQVGLILLNNLSAFAGAIYIFDGTGMKVQGLITLSMALVNAAVMILLFRKSAVDKRLIYLIIAIVLSFVSLAIPVQLNGHVITMFWAAEIVILLWLWQKSGIKVFHAGFLLLSVLTLISYFMDACFVYFGLSSLLLYFGMYDPLPVVFNRIFITGLVVVAAFVASRFMLEKENGSGNGIVYLAVLKRTLTVIIWVMAYLVPFLEIYYQFGSSSIEGIPAFTLTMLAIYTTLYAAVLSLIFSKKIEETGWALASLIFFVILYLAFALPAMIELRDHIYHTGLHRSLFPVHYLSLPALACVFYVAARGIRKLSKQVYAICGCILVACSVVILSVELDNTVAQLWAMSGNYLDLLYDVQTFGYPILWGILAMLLMIWGLKAKEALLRQISLGFFALIILKFYVRDIWLMSQTGRIISFVVLGIILLLVSFLIQKIKVLIKDDADVAKPEK